MSRRHAIFHGSSAMPRIPHGTTSAISDSAAPFLLSRSPAASTAFPEEWWQAARHTAQSPRRPSRGPCRRPHLGKHHSLLLKAVTTDSHSLNGMPGAAPGMMRDCIMGIWTCRLRVMPMPGRSSKSPLSGRQIPTQQRLEGIADGCGKSGGASPCQSPGSGLPFPRVRPPPLRDRAA